MTRLEIKDWLLANGVWDTELIYTLTHGADPSRVKTEWLEMRRPRPLAELPTHPKLVNHFAVGADPELQIWHEQHGTVNAESARLHTGLAFGADLSGRQAELRPAASRWALAVVGSTLQELRFLVLHVERSGWRGTELRAAPWDGRDGFGGHVHFGRKLLALRQREVAALDAAYISLAKLGVFNWDGIRLRQRSRGGYGMPGDIRPQVHGYEYRSFPTWLDSPWLAYFVLTLSKLLVVRPELADALRNANQLDWAKQGEELLKNVFAYFQGMDDDARMVLWLLDSLGFPRYIGGNIRPRWGLEKTPAMAQRVDIYPPCIAATPLELKELWVHFTQRKPLEWKAANVSWANSRLAGGFVPLLGLVSTHGLIGIGEICWDLCCHAGIAVGIGITGGDERQSTDVLVSSALASKLVANWRAELAQRAPGLRGVEVEAVRSISLKIGHRLRQNDQIANARRMLTCGVFPVWKAGAESEAEAEEFRKRNNPVRKGLWGIKELG